ncbi:hypothetical protein GCM10009527_000240 [Actinomadura nitritigenes]
MQDDPEAFSSWSVAYRWPAPAFPFEYTDALKSEVVQWRIPVPLGREPLPVPVVVEVPPPPPGPLWCGEPFCVDVLAGGLLALDEGLAVKLASHPVRAAVSAAAATVPQMIRCMFAHP